MKNFYKNTTDNILMNMGLEINYLKNRFNLLHFHFFKNTL